MRLPSTRQATNPAIPALTCTTVPPAKSLAPRVASQPPPHTMWAIGAYTKVSHSPMNHSTAENFIRSANAPMISAGVIAAKVS